MSGYHALTGIRPLPRNGWKVVHFSRFSNGQEITTSHTIGLPDIRPFIRENIHIRGFEKNFAEAILDTLVSLLIERGRIIEPGDTVEYGRRKFLVLRENIPPSICTKERSILVIHFLEPTEQHL